MMGVGILALVGKFFGHHVQQAEIWIRSQGIWAPVVYILIYCIMVAFLFSVDVLSFAAGVMFGLFKGFLYAYAGTVFCAALIFFIGRYLAYKRVSAFVKRYPKLDKIDSATSENGFKIMLMLRLSPLPFAPLSYTLSITKVSFPSYILASCGMILTNFVSVYYGYVAHHVTRLAGGQEYHPPTHYVAMIGMLLVTLATVIVVTRIVRKALNDAGAS